MRTAIITIGLVVLVVCGPVNAMVYFDDGGYHLIDYVINDGVKVDYDKPDAGTQLEIASGGWITQTTAAHGKSKVTVNGGNAYEIITFDYSQIVMHSGIVQLMGAAFNNEVKIYGGEITEGIYIGGNSSAIISSGTIGEIDIDGSGYIIMSGGTNLNNIVASLNGLISLIGSDFQVNGHNVGYGDRASTWAIPGIDPWGQSWLTGTVTGVLENGDTINNNFMFYQNGDIKFVPEPATFLILLAGAFIIRNQNRK